MNAIHWVGIAAAVWIVVAMTLAVLWHRFMKAQPSVLRYDGQQISRVEADYIRELIERDRNMRGGA